MNQSMSAHRTRTYILFCYKTRVPMFYFEIKTAHITYMYPHFLTPSCIALSNDSVIV